MEITGEYRIAAKREDVWTALNDPEILRQCIPGCETLDKRSATEFSALVRTTIGPISARFDTRIELTDLDPPSSYTLTGGGQGGAAGFSRGTVDVELIEEDMETVLRYAARLHVGGRLAQVGSRLVVGATRKVAAQFFERFTTLISGGEALTAAG